jgi:hypothetical protein
MLPRCESWSLFTVKNTPLMFGHASELEGCSLSLFFRGLYSTKKQFANLNELLKEITESSKQVYDCF